ncbi:hypothetical protein QVD17_01981 [Tagetes erecta]|uniref:Uncharacterized protein n=1 Tax=Tagetes erecta TaxID=13708 RepID=A0AAD8P7C1_TARER|nr:hypothetical protein QVD17_01981 [Tagetes erecta]
MASFSNDSRIMKIKKPLPKPQMLRDYLLDDMSSCSSNGFRSYPRHRQCCTTVRFLVETDLSYNHRTSNFKPKQSSLLQKASNAMIHVFKRLPFTGNVNLLPRSLSRKLLKRNLSKNTNTNTHQLNQPNNNNNDVKRLKSFGDLLKENESYEFTPSRVSAVVTATTTTELTKSTSDGFTAGNCTEVDLGQNDVVDEIMVDKKMTNETRVDSDTTTATATSTTTTTATNYSDSAGNAKKWHDKHDEQFSPVSVMDFPTDNDDDVDEDDEVSSGLSRKYLDVKGTKPSSHKTRVSDRVSQLEPVKLEDRIALSVLESPTTTFLDFEEQENQIEKKAMALLQLMKSTVSSHYSLKCEVVENVLLGYFIENALEENVSDYEMLEMAKKWIDGQEQDIFLDWECNNNRERYLRDMEKGVNWSKYGLQLEKDRVVMEMECCLAFPLSYNIAFDQYSSSEEARGAGIGSIVPMNKALLDSKLTVKVRQFNFLNGDTKRLLSINPTIANCACENADCFFW